MSCWTAWSTSFGDKCRRRASTMVATGVVDAQWLFNQLRLGILVIDARNKAQYEAGTILSAISVLQSVSATSVADVEASLSGSHLAGFQQRRQRHVVIFDDQADTLDSNAGIQPQSSWKHLLSQWLVDEGVVLAVATVSDTFDVFLDRYPFYTTVGLAAVSPDLATERILDVPSYPNEVMEGFLFLGNKWHATSLDIVQNLGITHVILDVADADITAHFAPTYAFLDAAYRGWLASRETKPPSPRPPRVLVHCAHGMSRSATLVIMFLMRQQAMSLVTAFNRVAACRPIIYPNEGFVRALMDEERRIFRSSASSLTFPTELDALLWQQLPDRPVPNPPPARCDIIFTLPRNLPSTSASASGAASHARPRPVDDAAVGYHHSVPLTNPAALFATSMSVGEELPPPCEPTSNSINHAATSTALTLASPTTMPPAVVRKRQVRTGRVNCRWLYNQVQAQRGIILIDTRTREAFEEDTIPSAISIPPIPDARTIEDVEAAMLSEQKYLFAAKKRKLRDVVLFGDAVKTTDGSPRDERAWIRRLELLIVDDGMVTSVKTLYDGFLTFKYRYPFYTTSAILDEIALGLKRTQSGTHNVNYPNEILEGFLFLGNMWHAQSEAVVQNLGITHIVNASLDTENVFENEGVKYFEVKIKDRPDADISAFFNDVYAFIEEAKRMQHGRVLVHCTQGISRSATLVIMYLMRSNNWSLVTAVNFALASRGVVYPNEGFLRSLMDEEFRLYKGNSIAHEELDMLLQHQIPDRPVPFQMRNRKSEICSQCSKLFSLLEWKHKCSYCKKEFCSKCTSTRLAPVEREKHSISIEEIRKPRRVCDVCVNRLWKINLPRPRKGLHLRYARCKHLNVNSLSTFGKPVCISYFEGTESQVILDVIKTRFDVKASQIIDIATENGDPVRDLTQLPDEAVVLVSIGKAGNIQDSMHKLKHHDRRSPKKSDSHLDDNEARDRYQSILGTEDALDRRHQNAPFRRSFSSPTMKRSQSTDSVLGGADADKKFRELWKISFPTMGVIDRQALLKIEDPMVLTDVMLGMSSLACGTSTLPEFNQRLIELGYKDEMRAHIMSLLEQAVQKKS
ncbi:TPA: hypothetical protein N0F65_004811 [Lagenidium giganteum]|uniref:Protein-tyrosine-phosphatase n=1 Tax=Lagenidium giganteum TaxID=4803 RepID=A0AAV2Z786_9STRA|nr:TPA: hypothetical protein N0F65_004811 [Lagenidium giganteum]